MEVEGTNSFITFTIVLGILVGACVLLLFYILNLLKSDPSAANKTKNEKFETDKKKDHSSGAKSKKKAPEGRWSGRPDKQNFSHPWLLTSLKGHSAQVLDMDFASNGKYLASAAEEDPDPGGNTSSSSSSCDSNPDNSSPSSSASPTPSFKDRTVLLWDTKDLTQKEHKSLRINVEFDHATSIKWSPDCKAFIISKYNANSIEVYKVEKKKDSWLGSASKALTFPKIHDEDIIGIGIACNGKFIMTCSNKTDLTIWDLRGQELARIDTYLMNTSCAKISPCGKFIVASGFAPDVKVWEVIFNKAGDFQEVKRVFELTGHSSGVYNIAFDVDTSHIATVSKDGTWKLYDTKVDYKRGEDPHLKITSKYEMAGSNAHIALSPTADVVVIGTYNALAFYSTLTGQLDTVIENIFDGSVTALLFDSTGKYVLASGDKYIRVFHNITGYLCDISTAKEKLKQNQTSATKDRLEKLVQESKAFLDNLGISA